MIHSEWWPFFFYAGPGVSLASFVMAIIGRRLNNGNALALGGVLAGAGLVGIGWQLVEIFPVFFYSVVLLKEYEPAIVYSAWIAVSAAVAIHSLVSSFRFFRKTG